MLTLSERPTVRASCSAGVVELSTVEAVDAIQRLHGPGVLSCDVVEVLEAGGSVVVGGWRFEGTGLYEPPAGDPAMEAYFRGDDGRADLASATVLFAVAGLLLALVGGWLMQAAELLGGVQ